MTESDQLMLQRELLQMARDLLDELRKYNTPTVTLDLDDEARQHKKLKEQQRQRDRNMRGYAAAAHQGLLASGKWRPEEHGDLVARSWDLAKQMLAEDEHRLGGDG